MTIISKSFFITCIVVYLSIILWEICFILISHYVYKWAMHYSCSSSRHDLQSRDKKVVPIFSHFYEQYFWHFEGWLLMSPSGKLHCVLVLIEIFSHSSHCADWFKLISHRRGHYCIVSRLNHSPLSRHGWYTNPIPAVYFANQSGIKKCSAFSVPIYLQ